MLDAVAGGARQGGVRIVDGEAGVARVNEIVRFLPGVFVVAFGAISADAASVAVEMTLIAIVRRAHEDAAGVTGVAANFGVATFEDEAEGRVARDVDCRRTPAERRVAIAAAEIRGGQMRGLFVRCEKDPG